MIETDSGKERVKEIHAEQHNLMIIMIRLEFVSFSLEINVQKMHDIKQNVVQYGKLYLNIDKILRAHIITK